MEGTLERSLIAGIENVCYSKEERVEKSGGEGGEKRKKRKENDVDRRTRKYRAREVDEIVENDRFRDEKGRSFQKIPLCRENLEFALTRYCLVQV